MGHPYPYLIEFRLGHARWKVFDYIRTIGAEYPSKVHDVPHFSLYGPFRLKQGKNLQDLKRAIESVARDYDFISYEIDGWACKKTHKGRVIAFNIKESTNLSKLWRDFKSELLECTVPKNSYDTNPDDRWAHITLAHKLGYFEYIDVAKRIGYDLRFFDQFISHLLPKHKVRETRVERQSLRPIYLPLDALRITVLHNKQIAAEYDLLRKTWLTRDEALNKFLWGDTLHEYRIRRGYEILPRQNPNNNTYIIADLHLGHANIIKYCARPFRHSEVDLMDRVLIKNWNSLVKETDKVYFLGDLCLCDAKQTQNYIAQLNGDITFIRGNHDRYIPNSLDRVEVHLDGIKFLLTHDPRQGESYDGWTIHGHVHNNHLKEYGAINRQKRTINVSAEVIGFKPVELRDLIRRIQANR